MDRSEIALLVKESLKHHLNEDPLDKAWRTGQLNYKVYDYQKPIKDAIDGLIASSDMDRVAPYVLNCSRRFGKTTLGCLAFLEQAIRYPGITLLFAAPTENEAREIVLDVMPTLLVDAPDKYRPRFKNSRYTFPNGSIIKIGGCFNGGETLRGRKAHGAFLDEAAHIRETTPITGLGYVLNSVIRPQLLTTGGWCLVASTPPPQLAHSYIDVYNQARAANRLKHFTIYDNTSIDPVYVEKLKQESYAMDPTGSSWKREYLAQFAVDSRTLIVPNWNSELAETGYPRPNRFEVIDRYVSYDHGSADLSVFLFGYWDYNEATLVIEKEVVLGNGAVKLSTSEISQIYTEERRALWGELPIRMEICDCINPQIIIDLNKDFRHRFVPPRKTNLEAMVNQLVNLVQSKQIKIDPKGCPILIQTLEQGTWKVSASGKREFARLPGIGHCDALAAAVYMARAVKRNFDPTKRLGTEFDYEKEYAVQVVKPLKEIEVLSGALNMGTKKRQWWHRGT